MNKTLFIFSNDFGELVLLRLLLYKQPFDAFLALPERLYEHVDFPNATKFLYQNADDLNKYVEEIQPGRVMIFSAYLIAPNGLITYPEFYSFLDHLDAKNITVCTSDPFMRYYDALDYEFKEGDFRSGIRNKLKEISERLAVYKHVYPVPMQFNTAPYQCFSNHFKRDIKQQTDNRKQWTFIMASEDFLLLQHGNAGMYHHTLIPLFTTLVNGHNIKINLVFPEAFYEILKTKLADITDINYVSYCGLDAFEDLVAQSDLMIYWNLFSASTLLCRLYNKPTVFLGQGHMETIFPGYFKYVKSSWFPYNDPEIMQIDDAFIPSLIKRLEGNEDPVLYQPYYELDTPSMVFSSKTVVV